MKLSALYGERPNYARIGEAVYNVTEISLTEFGILLPILADTAQLLPNLGMLANSAQLIRQNKA